jgi:UPF0716 protein FxsA
VILRLGSIIKTALAVWFLAEIALFVLIIANLGLGLTLLLGFGTTFLGFMVLGKASRETLNQLNSGRPNGYNFVLLGPARVLAAILLILPGFLSDLIGLILVIPLFGKMFSAQVSRQYAARRPEILDLDASEWRSAEEKRSHAAALTEKL